MKIRNNSHVDAHELPIFSVAKAVKETKNDFNEEEFEIIEK